MAEPVLVKDCRLWLGPYALQGALNAVTLNAGKVKLASNRMGDIAETFNPGLQQIDFTAKGFWAADAATTSLEPDTIIYPRINPTLEPAAWPLTLAPPHAPAATPEWPGTSSTPWSGSSSTTPLLAGRTAKT
jgi:hypothetical protein